MVACIITLGFLGLSSTQALRPYLRLERLLLHQDPKEVLSVAVMLLRFLCLLYRTLGEVMMDAVTVKDLLGLWLMRN